MKKHIRRTIKNIEFKQSAACIELTSPGKSQFLLSIVIALPFILGGLAFWLALDVPPAGLLFIGLGIFLAALGYFRPKYEWIEIDQVGQTFRYHIARFASEKSKAKAKSQTFSLQQTKFDWEIGQQGNLVTTRVIGANNIYWLTGQQEKHNPLFEWYSSWAVEAGLDVPDDPDPALPLQVDNPDSTIVYEHKDKHAVGHAAMLREIASWGRSSLFLGLVHLVASGFLNPGWGVTLLVVGGLSFLVQEASMFILYAVTLVWVGVSNSLSTELGFWTLFGLYQIYLGIRLFGKYKRYRDHEQQHLDSLEEIPPELKVGRSARFFPWVGSLLSLLGLTVYGGSWIFFFVSMVISYSQNQTADLPETLYTALDLIGGVALGLGIVGFALSLAAVVSKYKPRWVAWFGVVLGGILVLIEILLNIWVIFGG